MQDLKRIPRFGDTGINKAKKTLYVNKNQFDESVDKSSTKYNINSITGDEMKLLGFTKKEIKENPKNVELNGVKFGYKTAISQFNNRFLKYLP